MLAAAVAALSVTFGSAGLLLVGAGPALAHNVLISTDPGDGAVLDEAPETVSLTFDQPVSTFEPVLRVFGPNGNDFAGGAPQIVGGTISVPFSAGAAGDYRVAYRVISADGHPVSGQFTFTLSDSAAGDATGTVPEDPSADSGSSVMGWVWILVGAAAVAVVIAGIVALVKRRK